jgi:GDP-L-fucose synthase
LQESRPEYLFIAAAKVGGIQANNTYRAEFLYQNLMIEANLIHGAHLAGVQRLMFLGSSCIYPKLAPQPLREDSLLTGPLEPTNEPYAIAKIAGIKLCESYNRQYGRQYVSAMPTNLYGPNDNYDLTTAMFCQRSSARRTKPSCVAMQNSSSGVPVRRCVSFCTLTTWPMPAFT